jgi:hypothetical protein
MTAVPTTSTRSIWTCTVQLMLCRAEINTSSVRRSLGNLVMHNCGQPEQRTLLLHARKNKGCSADGMAGVAVMRRGLASLISPALNQVALASPGLRSTTFNSAKFGIPARCNAFAHASTHQSFSGARSFSAPAGVSPNHLPYSGMSIQEICLESKKFIRPIP